MRKVIYDITTYAAFNNKCLDALNAVEHLKGALVESEDAWKMVLNTLSGKIKSLNEAYPKTRPFRVDNYLTGGGGRISITDNADRYVCIIYYVNVTRVIL